jgi:hypothetical protein
VGVFSGEVFGGTAIVVASVGATRVGVSSVIMGPAVGGGPTAEQPARSVTVRNTAGRIIVLNCRYALFSIGVSTQKGKYRSITIYLVRRQNLQLWSNCIPPDPFNKFGEM